MLRKDILKKLDKISDLKTLPTIALEVNDLMRNPEVSMEAISDTLKKDPVMAAKILRLVNSSFFGFSSNVSSIERAVILLGYNTIRNAVISISFINAFPDKVSVIADFDVNKFWIHSIEVAVISRYLAEKLHFKAPEDCFTAGLLHDIGKLVLLQQVNDMFKKILEFSKKNHLSFYEAETSETGIDHAQIGAIIAKKWNLPQNLIDTIRWHHEVNKEATDYNMLLTVNTADLISNCIGMDLTDTLDISLVHPDSMKIMKPIIDSVSVWYSEILEEITTACKFFIEG